MSTERSARRLIHKGMTEGVWVMLHNAHNAQNLLNSLEAILAEDKNTDSQFRLWITSEVNVTTIPISLLQNSIRAVIDTPKVMKDSILRSFTWFEPDILKQSSRPEWAIMLHNLCYLHAAIQLRARYGKGGWNNPSDFFNIGHSELMEALNFMITEFKDPLQCTAPDGSTTTRSTSWTGIRYMLSEVIYGSYVTDYYDQQSLSAIIDFWVSTAAVKKDFDVQKFRYKHRAAFFNPNVRLNTLIQALDHDDAFNNYGNLDVPEACHMHLNVETLLGDDQYVFTRLNKVFDAMPSSDTLSHKLFPRPPTPFDGPALAGISKYSNNPSVVSRGVFATASHAALKLRKDIELWEICHNMLQKVPKPWSRDYVIDRIRKNGDFTPFNKFIMKEVDTMSSLLNEIKNSLRAIKNACETDVFGDQLSEHMLSVADDLYYQRVPLAWCRLSGDSAPPLTWSLSMWLNELKNRCQFFQDVLQYGRDRNPTYWLGAFFNPRGLLAILKQEAIKHYCGDRSGNFEHFVFQTEVTTREKDHIQQPAQQGMYIYGIYIWGCAWEKTTTELMDSPPKSPGYATIPVVQLYCIPANEKPTVLDPTKAYETYQCPVYPSRIAPRDPILEMDVRRENIPATRWALRGLSATLRPY